MPGQRGTLVGAELSHQVVGETDAGVNRKVTGWGAMLAFGAVVAEKLRRLVGDSDRSS